MAETYDITLPVLVAVSAIQGGVFWRQNCGTFRSFDGRRVVQATSIDGVADIMGALRGRPVAIETKTKRGQQRETQRRFQRAWEQAGGLYIIARSPEDALAALGAP
jgi:hypothetical protein